MITAMIVDDENLVRMGLRKTIPWSDLGIDIVAEAEDGERGLEAALHHRPDLIITDIKMPFMDGVEFMRRVRENGLDAQFIVLSGYSDFEYAKGAIRYGAMDYIVKPVENGKLVEALNRIRDRLLYQKTVTRIGKEKLIADLIAVLRKIRVQKTKVTSKTVEQALDWIHEHYAEEISISSLALRLHISPSYLMHIFKENMHEPIGDYVTAYRMEQAKAFLSLGTYKIYEVSDRVGYSDSRYFGQLFKKHTGLTPREFLKSEMYK